MFTTPNVVFALSVLNLLLCAGGLLFVYFDWNAARRREYLYLYFTEEKPSQEYFAAARRRRSQYTRLVWAFSILSVRQFLSVLLTASVSQPADWAAWLLWWTEGVENPNIRLAIAIQPWLGLLEAIGLALLGFALLYEWQGDAHGDEAREPSSAPTVVLIGFVTLWSLITLGYVLDAFGDRAQPVVQWATLISRVAILSFLIVVLRERAEKSVPAGLLVFQAGTITAALSAWMVLPSVGDIMQNPAAYPAGLFIAFALLVGAIARGTLNDYEGMELSRHRLGRERSIVFSFLKRLGEAFTTGFEVKRILKIILDSALETTEASAGAIYLLDRRSGRLEPELVLNFFPPMYVEVAQSASERRTEELEEQMRARSFALGEGVIGEVASLGEGRLIADVRAQGIMLGATTEYMRNRSMIVVPLRVREETLGVMAVLNKQRDSFTPEDQSLLKALADQAALSINNALLTREVAEQVRLRRELDIAREIQQQLLPGSCPRVSGFEIAARGTSATEVGGDYYDFFWVDDDHLGIVVADVSGKGVAAALVVAILRSAFRIQAGGNTDVRDVLCRINAFITGDLRRDMFVTGIYGILEISTRRFSWARAGHEPLLLMRADGSIEQREPAGFALGMIEPEFFDSLLEVETVELEAGDRMLLFTDGLTEAMDDDGQEFGMERIVATLRSASERAQLQAASGTTNGHNSASESAASKCAVSEATERAVTGSEARVSTIFQQGVGCNSGSSGEMSEMRALEFAVSEHVGEAAPSDDLTIVLLAVH